MRRLKTRVKVISELFQIIDANLNRTREGLRVCEDISRFIIKDKMLSRALKLIRHNATNAILDSKIVSLTKLLQTRNTKKDVLKFVDFKKKRKRCSIEIFMANIERIKESLRVLEECFKIIDGNISQKYRKMRFNAYDVEKKAIEKIRSLPSNR